MTSTRLNCQRCQGPFHVDSDPENPFSQAALRMTRYCPACAELLVAEHEAEDKRRREAALEARWARVCPEEYRCTDLSDPRVPSGFSDAARGWSATGRKGLGLIADSGRCKTRVLYVCLHKAFTQGLWTHAITHSAFRKVVLSTFGQSGESRSEAERRLEMLYKVDVLLLDDLGKAPKDNESSDSELVELIERRTASRKLLLWSSQAGGDWIEHRFGPDRGPAIVRRLAEFTQVVTA